MISYEVFFPRRARDAMSAGAELLLAPTNASSYGTGQMHALELGAARLRALETGRVVLQAAPTGFSAVVDPDGDVRRVTALGEQAALRATVELRTGRTPYTRLGDGPFVVAAAGALVAAWGAARAGRSGPSSPGDRAATVTSPPPAARAGR
jgi:apolipoprotein N-acyltransferase